MAEPSPRTQAQAQLHATLRTLGRAGLGLPVHDAAGPTHVGRIVLHAHQREAVRQLLPRLDTHGGALLADDVGLGKTFVALAVAEQYGGAEILAPAPLVSMWRDAIARAAAPATLRVHSLHRCSRRMPHDGGERGKPAPDALAEHGPAAGRDAGATLPRLVIIDEAHHLRNPATRRYATVAVWCRGARVLLLSASPVVNRTVDLAHLFALFLGSRAHGLPPDELARLIVRRTAAELDGAIETPSLITHPPRVVPDAPSVTRALSRLPPPVPTRDGQAAGALVALGLIRAWCSSAAACLALVRRRRRRAETLDDLLAQERWPSHGELRAWTITDDAVQLGFTSLLVASNERSTGSAADCAAARVQLARHLDALAELERLVRASADVMDRARLETLRAVRAAHRGVPVIVFTQFAETVTGLGRLLRWDAGVATLTARGGRVAGGPMPRAELLRRVAPHAHGVSAPPAHERILLLLTTDLLAEGVNLQDAGVVVHCDLPWTPTALAQREGRIARLGSRHTHVHAYTIAPPGGGAALLSIAARLRRKARAARVALTPDDRGAPTLRLVSQSPPASTLLRTLRQWMALGDDAEPARCAAPAVAVLRGTTRSGWLAAIDDAPGLALCGGWFIGATRRSRATRDPRTLRALVVCAATALEHAREYAPEHAPEHAAAHARAYAAAPSADHERTAAALAFRAIRAARARTRAHAVVDTVQSPQLHAQRALRELLSTASISDRLALAPQVARASRSLRTLRGAGDERALQSLLGRLGEFGTERWLEALIALGAPRRDSAPDDTSAAEGVLALLLLLP